jgi:Ca-activated chloride channel family protein
VVVAEHDGAVAAHEVDVALAVHVPQVTALAAGEELRIALGQPVAAQVPVSTIAFGTPNGTVTIPDTGETVSVPVDAPSLARIAEATGGRAYEAATQGQLADVYAKIGSSIGYDTALSQLTQWFMGAALLGFLLAGAAALAWSNRLP